MQYEENENDNLNYWKINIHYGENMKKNKLTLNKRFTNMTNGNSMRHEKKKRENY